MRLAKALVRLLTHNPGWKLLSLAIAVVVWVMVANEPELSTFVTVGVEYKDLPEDLEISSDPVTSVKLELRGPSGELGGVGSGHPEVILDMSKVRAGERTFPIGDGNVKLLRGVRLERAIPSEVHIRFERHAERSVKVNVNWNKPGGYEVTEPSVEPDSLLIAGPASRVQRIDSVLTDPVNVPARVGTFEFTVNAFIEDPYVRFPDPQAITVRMTVEKK